MRSRRRGEGDARPDSAGSPGIRGEHVELTRTKILEAVNQLLTNQHPAALSIPAVAREAGISTATIYRHFGTKEALLDASAAAVDHQTRAWLGDEAIVPGTNLGRFMAHMWTELARDLPALRASHFSPVGRDLRNRRSARRHGDAERGLTEAGVDLDTNLGQQLLRMALVLTSSTIVLEQMDRLGMSASPAAADVTWAIETLTASVVRSQNEPTRTEPPTAAAAPWKERTLFP